MVGFIHHNEIKGRCCFKTFLGGQGVSTGNHNGGTGIELFKSCRHDAAWCIGPDHEQFIFSLSNQLLAVSQDEDAVLGCDLEDLFDQRDKHNGFPTPRG